MKSTPEQLVGQLRRAARQRDGLAAGGEVLPMAALTSALAKKPSSSMPVVLPMP